MQSELEVQVEGQPPGASHLPAIHAVEAPQALTWQSASVLQLEGQGLSGTHAPPMHLKPEVQTAPSSTLPLQLSSLPLHSSANGTQDWPSPAGPSPPVAWSCWPPASPVPPSGSGAVPSGLPVPPLSPLDGLGSGGTRAFRQTPR